MKTKFILYIMLPLILVMLLSFKINNFWFPCLLTILFLDGLFGLIRITKNQNKLFNINDLNIIKLGILPSNKTFSIFGIIFTNNINLSNNEKEHILKHKIQAYETGWLLLYFIYILEFIYWFILFLLKGNPNKNKYSSIFKAAYNNVCFEQELIKNFDSNRIKYNWLNWLFEGSN